MTRARIFRLAISLALASLAVGLGGLSFYREVQSFQPLGFEASPLGGGMAVERVDHPASGLLSGDQIFTVQGETATPETLTTRLREQPASELTVLRGDQLLEVKYERPPLEPDFPYLILSLIGAVYLCVGLFTVLRHGGGQSFLFYLWCLTSAGLYLASRTGAPDLAYRAIYLFDVVCHLLLPALTVHLFLVFPTRVEAAGWMRRIIPFVYLPAAALALLNGRQVFGRPTPEQIQALDRLGVIHFTVLSLAALGLLLWRFRRGAAWEQHRQMQWMAWGVAGGYLPFLLLYYVPYALRLTTSELLTSIAVLPLALVPLTFAYAILRYKLWDIEVIVRDTISATLTLLLGILGFSLINLMITRGVSEEFSFARNLLAFGSGLGIAALLVPTRGALSSALERLQYRGTFGKRQALSGLGRELLLERDLGRLCAVLLGRIEEGVSLEAANLYLCQGDSLRLIRQQEGLPALLPFDAFGEGFWQRDVERLSGVALPAGEMTLPTRLFVAGYRYAFPILVRGRGIGIALTGFKREHTPLNGEDTELIRHLLNQASLAIENAQLLGQLQIQLEEVQQLQRYTEGIFESSPAGIAVLDSERRLLSVNSAFAAIVCRERDDLVGQSLESVLPVRPLPAPGESPVEVSWCDACGQERYLQLSLAAFERGRRQGLYVLVAHDVSERVAMENALREKDRLAALGMLAAGVAHEVNTPITGISSYAQMLLQDTPPSDPHYEILKKVERQTFRAARIVNNLLEFARNRQKERKPVALAPLVTECLDLLGERLGKRRIELEWTPPEDKILVMGCDGELQQVVTNLIVNALDAMSETGGRLRVGIETNGSKAVVRIQDNGPGVPPEKLEKIFQPFYSTKLNRGGTGLGLSISYEIVRRHGGDLRVVSPPGEGACFLVELPLHNPAAPRGHGMNILIVDDEEVLQDILTVLIRREGHTPLSATTGEEGLALLEREEVDLVLLDLMLPGMHGMEVLREIRRRDPEQVVVVITAFSSIESAIEAMREGAFNYIPKPFKNEEVLLTIRKGLEQRRLTAENRSLKEQLRQRFGFDNIIGKSKPMQQVYELIQLAAPAKSNILVLGESGTGKELVAKAIHHHSRRADGPFVTVNSGSMPADLLESNLFGHVRGAFTGAVTSKKGLFELADGGSVFFDEIGNIPLDTQSKLLRVIQEREFMRLGGLETIRVDVRIIAATNADLENAVLQGAFREDLFYRLNVITVTLPPLRKRTEDVRLLAQHFLAHYARENEKAIRDISPRAMEMLLDYHWPGNVRELENAIERAVVLSTGEVLTEDLLPPSLRQRESSSHGLLPPTLPSNGISFKDAVSEYERQIIIRALQSCGGVQKRAAELLHVKPTTLHEMMKRLNISSESLVTT